MKIISVCLCAGLALLLPLGAQHDASKEGKKKNPAMGNPEAIAAGMKLYQGSCAACHGTTGQGGRGPNLRQRGAWHPLDDDALYRTIQKGVPSSDMPALNLPEAQLWQLAAFVRSLTAPAAEAQLSGDARAGEELFWGKGNCSNCHRLLGRGGMLGPDLSNIGATKPAEDIRESIVDPDADGFLRYKGVTAVLKSGQTIKGVARNRTNYSIQVQDAQGTLHLLSMTNVKQLTFSDHSPMPRDFATRFSKRELDNLLAFLAKQSVRPYEREDKEEKK
ncbi:MAG: c-type cytochrome [Candidatus Solibacter usitatus]|nr:c-type cytochrome [Candidatus Solibacter usitatus]